MIIKNAKINLGHVPKQMKRNATIKVYASVVQPIHNGELWNGDNVKIAEIPSGALTQEIADKIIAAYIKKGSALTIGEVLPFYESAASQDKPSDPSNPINFSGMKIDASALDADVLPCPFCGAKAEFEYRDYDPQDETGDDGTGWVVCTGCGLKLFGHDRDDTVKLWNTRK